MTRSDLLLKAAFHSIKLLFINAYILDLSESTENFLVPIINPLMLLFVNKLVLLDFPASIPLIFLVIRSDTLGQFFKIISESAE